jgi:hypothetical protein
VSHHPRLDSRYNDINDTSMSFGRYSVISVAVQGDLATARARMAEAADPGHAPAPPRTVKKGPAAGSTVSPEDNYI